MKQFNVLLWDFNSDKLIHYDVLSYLRNCYKKYLQNSKKHSDVDYWKVPKTLEEFKEFVKKESQYQFWARCEYEMICHGWPVRKNDYKLDVHEQIMMNLDIVAKMLYDEFLNNMTFKMWPETAND